MSGRPVKFYSTRLPPLSLDTLGMMLSDPPPVGSSVIFTGKMTYLFQHDQADALANIVDKVLALCGSFPESSRRCKYASKILASLNMTLPSILSCIAKKDVDVPRIRCISCDLCKRISSFRKSLKLAGEGDISRLMNAMRPQILPKKFSDLGPVSYRIEPFSIHLLHENNSTTYIPVLDRLSLDERIMIYDLIKKIRSYEWQNLRQPVSIDLPDIMEERKALARRFGRIEDRLLPFVAYSSVGLSDLYPLLVDDDISEFFVDKESSFAYLDHRNYGRCNSSLFVSKRAMCHLLTFAKMASGKVMDYFTPSLRASLKTKEFYVRISADMPPLSMEGTSMSVRKFFAKPMDLKTLISNETMSVDAATYCKAQIEKRKNFTIYGESGSGKTTLAVALDLLTPRSWRKISVESDVAENVSQQSYGKHQIRLLASSASKADQEKRVSVLNSLLHKSPDYVFFGEVLSREDSESLFQILAAGLKCIHTIHADSGESLLRRWTYQHKIPVQSLNDLDVLLQMRKLSYEGRIFRRVYRISEVVKDQERSEMPRILDVFLWDESKKVLRPVSGATVSLSHEGQFENYGEVMKSETNLPSKYGQI